jgi:Sec-independent protein translocase protein TatA
MDYVTRQFINLTKKFRKDLRKIAADLNRALHKQTEAIRESNQAAETQQSPAPEVTVLNHLPESIQVHQNAKDTGDERNYRRAMFFITALTLGAIVI